ncbi:MAG: heme exporter protein CcmB [Candidatus Lokiarchaeota archaeon]|jgi:ABC-type transport system involved in cytochrome c biogenesis permease component
MTEEENTFKSKIKSMLAILRRDIKSEVRQINDLFSISIFDVISIFIFSSVYTFSTQNTSMPIDIFVIQIWIIIFFTLIFIMTKLLIKEKESGTLGGLLTSPISPNIILTSKTIFCLILLCIVEFVLFTFSIVISLPSIQILSPLQVVNYVLIGIGLPTIDLSICGTIVSAFSMYAKNKSFVLPILLFPIILPITNPIISLNIKLLMGDLLSDVIYEILFLLFHIILMSSILSLVSDHLLFD